MASEIKHCKPRKMFAFGLTSSEIEKIYHILEGME